MKKLLLCAALLLSSAAAPAEDAHPCRVAKLGSLPIAFTRLQPTVPAKFNGIELRLVMDSGAPGTTLFPAGVDKAGLRRSHSNIVRVGVGGRTETYVAYADEVEIGPSHGKGLAFLEAVSAGVAGDGLLGADYLFRTDLELVLRDNQVTFIHADGDCGDKPLAYWDRDAFWVDTHDTGDEDRRQQIEVKINGHRFTALLDTGAMHSVLDLDAAARIGLTPDSAGVEKIGESAGVGEQKMTVWRAPIDSFEIGDEAIRKTRIQIADLLGAARRGAGPRLTMSEPDILLGADFMRAHHLLFARSQRRLYFTYLGGPVFQLAPSQPELAAQTARYREGAERNSATDMLAFAQALALGRGVGKDPVEAYKWLLIASQGGWAGSHPDFKEAVDREIASLLGELDTRGQAEAKSRAAGWTSPQ